MSAALSPALYIGPGWRIHGSVQDTKLSTNKQHTHSLSTPNPGKFGAVAEGDLYQPETGGPCSKYSGFADMEKFHTGAGRKVSAIFGSPVRMLVRRMRNGWP